jgi:hypothetical protein
LRRLARAGQPTTATAQPCSAAPPHPGRRGPAHSGSHSSCPCPGRNLGLGRESGHPPRPLLARQCAAVDLNRTDERAFREDKTVAASASHQTLAHFSFPFLFAFWRRKQQRAAAMVTVRRRRGGCPTGAGAGGCPSFLFLCSSLSTLSTAAEQRQPPMAADWRKRRRHRSSRRRARSP